ncbi:MAG: hydroxyacid dehydrogenase, partial [Lachnospiraceae bacterium]|nr:hydroxyacid dehydrogenase [Lachnospiraceae bacterium]
MKILITGAFPLTEIEKEELENAGHQVFFQQQESEITDDPNIYDAVVCNALFQFNPIEAFSSLKIIQLTSAGLDRVPMEYIRAHGIELYNASGVYSVPMAEFAIGGILQLYKHSRELHDSQREHRWIKQRNLLELSEKTVCIVGTGDVGCEIAKRLSAFGCHVIGVNRTVRSVSGFDEIHPLTELLSVSKRAKIMVCSLALTNETRGLIGRDVFDVLPDGAVFVNISRGALVDEPSLIAWLRSERSFGAVLDVFETEP